MIKKIFSLFAAILFAGSMMAAVVSGTTYEVKSASTVPDGWSVTNSYSTGGGGYAKLTYAENSILTDEFCQNGFTSIVIKARKFGSPSNAQAIITVEWCVSGSDDVVLGTVTPTSTTLTNYTISSPASVTANESGKIRISCKGAGSDKGSGVSEVTITYTEGSCGGGTPKTLSSVAVSGTPTKTSYYAGDNFDPAGLTVTGTYSDESQATITSGITWSYNPSQTLAKGQTTIGVTATVSEIASAEYNVTGLTVTEAPAAVNYEKVTAEPADWSGDYILVYEADATNARVWKGADEANNYAEATIATGVIAAPDGAAVLTIAKVAESNPVVYTIMVGDKYIGQTSDANGIKIQTTAINNSISYNGTDAAVDIVASSAHLRYNSASSSYFRYYKSATYSSQKKIQLYKKVDGTVKPAADLAYATADQKKLTKLGDAFTAPELSNPHSVAVTYASNNTDVAEVASNGAVTIKAVGVATITASYDGSGDYKEGSASYTIGVTAHAGTAEDPYSVADAKIVIDGIGTKEDAYVSGKISQVDSYNSTYKSITYWISADGTTSGQQIQVYSGKGIDGADFSSVDDVVAKATVVVKGTLKMHSEIYEFDYNNELVSYAAPVEPVVTLKQSDVIVTALNVDATSVANQKIDIVCASFESQITSVSAKLYEESTCETEITSGAWVIDITVNEAKDQVTFNVADNDGAARQVWMKVTAGDGSSEASAVLAISQAKYVAPYATLPFAFNGGRDAIESTNGLTQDGLGSDYAGTANLRFDNTEDYLILQINEDAGVLAFDIKGNGFSGGTFTVQTLEDGADYTDLKTYTELPTTVQTEIFKLEAGVRYIKWIYTEKKSGNVGLGNISVSKDTYSIAWSLGDGPEENLGVLGKMGDSDSYAKYFDKEILHAGTYTYNVKLYKNGAATPIATTTLPIEQKEAKKYYLQFDYNASTGVFTASASNPRTATSVDNTDATKKAVKFIENGQLFIEMNGRIYNVQGQTVK